LRIHSPLDRNWALTTWQMSDEAVTWAPGGRPRGLAGGGALSSVTPDGLDRRMRATQNGARSRGTTIRTHRRYQGGRMPVGIRAGTPKG
jgi:hypothetical protein